MFNAKSNFWLSQLTHLLINTLSMHCFANSVRLHYFREFSTVLPKYIHTKNEHEQHYG